MIDAIDIAYELIGKELIEIGTKILRKKLEDLKETVKAEYLPLIEDFKKNLTGELEGIALGEIVDTLDINTLKTLCAKHIIRGANQAVATMALESDKVFVYLAYAKDRELILDPKIVVIIRANTLDESVSELFKDSQLIIIK